MMNQAYLQAHYGQSNGVDQAVRAALSLYRSARVRAWLGKVWSALTGRSRHLLALNVVKASCALRGGDYVGTQVVPIRKIRGSEGRCKDFDKDFQPLQTHTKGRWLSVATAQQKGVTLPPVELLQVGDVYFVRDGHHRISVAKALGMENVDAEVTVCEVAGRLPWERPPLVGELAVQAT